MTNNADIIDLQATDGAMVSIHPRGAHLTRWVPAGARQSRLFLSEQAVFTEGVAIRGGVPVIFPQFAGEGPLPKHGFARTAAWALQEQPTAGEAQVRFVLSETTETLAIWPHAFSAQLLVTVGDQQLSTELQITNTGSQAFSFTAALHTYLQVDEISAVRITGLQGLAYRDTADGRAMKREAAAELRIAGEVDRNYFETPAVLMLHDGAGALQIEQQGFADTVVWNPGAEASKGFKDLAPEDYRRFVCIEAAAIQRPIVLAPGAQWQGQQTLRVA